MLSITNKKVKFASKYFCNWDYSSDFSTQIIKYLVMIYVSSYMQLYCYSMAWNDIEPCNPDYKTVIFWVFILIPTKLYEHLTKLTSKQKHNIIVVMAHRDISEFGRSGEMLPSTPSLLSSGCTWSCHCNSNMGNSPQLVTTCQLPQISWTPLYTVIIPYIILFKYFLS